MHALAGNRIQIDRQSGHQGFAFSGAHLGDLAVMQNHPAYQLHIVMAHPQHAGTRLTHHGKCLWQQRIK